MKPRLHVAMMHAAHDRSGTGNGIWSFAFRFTVGLALAIRLLCTHIGEDPA